MDSLQERLAALRRSIAGIDRKYARVAAAGAAVSRKPERTAVETLISGEVVRTPAGEHFEREKLWEPHRRYGSVGISELLYLPEDWLAAVSEGAITHSPPGKWAFLD